MPPRSFAMRNRALFAVTLGAGLAILACGTTLEIAPEATPDAGAGADGAVEADLTDAGIGICTGAACPQLVTQGYGAINKLALDDEAVYFTSFDRGLLGRVAKGGGVATLLLPEGGIKLPTALVVDGAWVYASAYTPGDGDGARRVPKAGGASERIDKCNTALSIAVDGTNVYWLTAVCGGPKRMRQRAKNDPDASAIVESMADEAGAYGYGHLGNASLDDTDVYWSSKLLIDKVAKAGLAGAAPETVFGPPATIEVFRGLAVADRLYALLGDRVIAVPKAGGAMTVLADAPLTKTESDATIVVADGDVYFTRPEAGVVARVPTAGGAVETLAQGQAQPTGLAVDAEYIYWSNAGDGTIWRRPR